MMSLSKQCGIGKKEHRCNCSFCREVDGQIHIMMQQAETDARHSNHRHSKKTTVTANNSNNNIQLGARVLVRGRYTGVIRYIGDLDSNFIDSKIYVGVKLDDPVGKHDGIHHGKRFFRCPPYHGVFVPIEQVYVTAIPGTGYGVKWPNKSPRSKATNSSNNHVSIIPTIGSSSAEPITSSDTMPSSRENLPKTLELDQDSSSMMLYRTNKSSLFSVKYTKNDPPAPRPKSAYVGARPHGQEKRDGAIAPSLRDFSPILSVQSSRWTYPFGGEENGTREENNHLNSFISKNESALKLPSPPHNEMNTVQWRNQIQLIKTDPTTSKLYLNNPPTPPPGLRECFAKEGMKRIEEKEFCNRSQHMQSNLSYTTRLLSGLPKQEMLMSSPVSADDKLKDVEQFGYLLKKWGGGEKGWRMATAVQKLKDAKRQGDTEIKWQKKIDELESDAEFSSQIKRIKKLHSELSAIRSKRENLESEIRSKVFMAARRPPKMQTFSATQQRESVIDYQRRALEEENICNHLKEAIKNHKMISHIDASSLAWLKAH